MRHTREVVLFFLLQNEALGSCPGDSGGPLVHFSPGGPLGQLHYVQVGLVSGGLGACGDRDLPGVYVRLDHPEVLHFIKSVSAGESSVSFWTQWGAWSACSRNCDSGWRKRTRGCVSTAQNDGAVDPAMLPASSSDCPIFGSRDQNETCLVQQCRESIKYT